jgi:hypothetical protein
MIYHLSHSTSPFVGFFKIESHELFAQAGSLSPKELGWQVWATALPAPPPFKSLGCPHMSVHLLAMKVSRTGSTSVKPALLPHTTCLNSVNARLPESSSPHPQPLQY